MSESIYTSRRPGFPHQSFNDTSYTTDIEYVGLESDLLEASPAKGTAWGGYQGLVVSADLESLPGTSYAILTVVCERKFDTSEATEGTKLTNETSYEIDWADVQRTMYEHPQFSTGGANALSVEDYAALESWKAMKEVSYKKEYYYYTEGEEAGITAVLPANAKLFAIGIRKGIEHWVEKVPVAKRSDTYVLGPPPAGTAGQKEDPTGFPNLPDGYEWIRDADRALRSGGQSSWTNETTWLGAKKVWVDVDQIFWTV